MINGKYLKQLVELIPDDAAVIVNGNWNVSVEGISVETAVDGWIASLRLTEGFSVTYDKIMDEMFNDIFKQSRKETE